MFFCGGLPIRRVKAYILDVEDVGNMRVQATRPRLTAKVDLPGGQDRLRQLILYVSLRCVGAERFGRVKLNKILWKADFTSYATRQVPVTGRIYQKLDWGPALKEMLPLLREMERVGFIEFVQTDFGFDACGKPIIESRPTAKFPPNLRYFSTDDLEFVEQAISYYWDKTGHEASDDSHGMAWKTRDLKETMYYELSYLSDDGISEGERAEILNKIRQRSTQRRQIS
jgi:hypothetical protein